MGSKSRPVNPFTIEVVNSHDKEVERVNQEAEQKRQREAALEQKVRRATSYDEIAGIAIGEAIYNYEKRGMDATASTGIHFIRRKRSPTATSVDSGKLRHEVTQNLKIAIEAKISTDFEISVDIGNCGFEQGSIPIPVSFRLRLTSPPRQF
ncbi:hypothetical protein EON76_04485 [bacterium]|nr:MAG: hypothetical protein EON76_04485 [bacterium]